ncbi:cytosolic protein [Liquorilactobacillus sucicola DSM 21376 = JCM 15457]|nr:YlbG family protein [Liquorilactobacillus sucicola]GAJ25350.1 cytosolic protein [Liquorilactobacillus sucicola DSM 21376 = JCM 15457]
MDFKINERQSIIVYLYHLKNSKQLRRYGTIHYVSRRMKYVVLYIDRSAMSETLKKLKEIRFVKRVALSPRSNIKINFGDEVGTTYKLTEEDREKYRSNKE